MNFQKIEFDFETFPALTSHNVEPIFRIMKNMAGTADFLELHGFILRRDLLVAGAKEGPPGQKPGDSPMLIYDFDLFSYAVSR